MPGMALAGTEKYSLAGFNSCLRSWYFRYLSSMFASINNFIIAIATRVLPVPVAIWTRAFLCPLAKCSLNSFTIWILRGRSTIWVSILIFRGSILSGNFQRLYRLWNVSILVLLEVALRHNPLLWCYKTHHCFNPCFIGSCSATALLTVFILFVLEFQSLFYWKLLCDLIGCYTIIIIF